MPSTAVIQVKRGIGDVVWHLPFIRAIAAATDERAVTFLTLPSTRAKDLLAADPSVGDVVYFEHHGSELARGINLIKLVALLESEFERVKEALESLVGATESDLDELKSCVC